MDLSNLIEAILFYQAEPITLARLAQLVKRDEAQVGEALDVLESRLSTTGIRLLRNASSVTLGTSPDASATIEAITKEELSKDLSKSALETLAIVLYKGPLTRAEIDYIRGVNSTFILRNLLIRGLVEKIENPNDQRSFHYKATFALLEYLGITKTEELPEYAQTLATLEQFIAVKSEEEKEAIVETSAPSESQPKSEEEGSPEDATETETGFPEIAPLSDEEIEADIMDEDAAGENFDDEELKAQQHAHE